MNDFWSLLLTGTTVIICVINAILSHKIFNRFRRSIAARAMIVAFILSAISMIVFFYGILARTQGLSSPGIGVIGFAFFLGSLVSMMIGLLDFKRHL